MKYYLLTFNDDWADEHNVPALQCFNEKDYNKWLSEPAGKLNPRYEEQKKQVEEIEAQWKKFWKDLEINGFVLNGSANSGVIPKGHPLELEKKRLDNLPRNYGRSIRRVFSYMSVNLGNNGDGFGEGYSEYLWNREFTEGRYSPVTVKEVSEDFYKTFKRAKLADLSLCNIFEFKADKWIDDDEEDEDEG